MARRIKRGIKRAGRAARSAGRGGGSTLLHGATGVAAFYGTRFLAGKVKFLQENWYAVPGLLLAAGHFAKRKPKFAKFGPALIGAAGATGAINYEFHQASVKANGEAKGVGRVYVAPRQLPETQVMPPLPEPAPEPAVEDTARLFVMGGRR